MRSISESFNIIISKLEKLQYPLCKLLNKPSAADDIQYWEQKFGFKFNKELIELYSLANGTKNDTNTPSGLLGLIPIHIFLSLKDSFEYYKNTIDYPDIFMHWDSELKPGKKLFPFLEDGAGNCYWVDLNDNAENYGKIYWTNTYDESPDYLYQSLSNFFHILSESFQNGIMFLDEEGFLDCNYEAFDDLSAEFNDDIEYWQEEEE